MYSVCVLAQMQQCLVLSLQLGIHAENPSEFLTQAKKIVTGHKELQGQLCNLQGHVSNLEAERYKLLVSSLLLQSTVQYKRSNI